VGGGGEWRTCAMRDDEPRPVWMSLLITHRFIDAVNTLFTKIKNEMKIKMKMKMKNKNEK
jgi:hypothetical protein